MKQAYIAIALSKRQAMQSEMEAICEVLEAAAIVPFIFVDRYHFTKDAAVEMMQKAKMHMDESTLLIAEVSHKAIGVGVEVGYMAAQGKTIIYLWRAGTDYSSTVGGLADYMLIYTDTDDLRGQLGEIISQL